MLFRRRPSAPGWLGPSMVEESYAFKKCEAFLEVGGAGNVRNDRADLARGASQPDPTGMKAPQAIIE